MQKEELKRREEIIKKDKLRLSFLREERNEVDNRLSNLNSDVVLFPDRVDLSDQKEEFTKTLSDIKNKIEFYVDDIQTAEIRLKKDMKEFREEERKRWRADLQARTLPAERQNEPYTKEELIELVNCEYDDETMGMLARKLERTFYGVEHVVRSKEYFLNKQRMPRSMYNEPVSELLEKVIKSEHDL